MNKEKQIRWIRNLIDNNQLWKFYKSREWISLKTEILKENHYECAECKKQGRLTRYDEADVGKKKLISTVHHINHVREHPELALSRTYIDEHGNEQPNLIPVCKRCHNRLHPEKFGRNKSSDKFMNVERW